MHQLNTANNTLIQESRYRHCRTSHQWLFGWTWRDILNIQTYLRCCVGVRWVRFFNCQPCQHARPISELFAAAYWTHGLMMAPIYIADVIMAVDYHLDGFWASIVPWGNRRQILGKKAWVVAPRWFIRQAIGACFIYLLSYHLTVHFKQHYKSIDMSRFDCLDILATHAFASWRDGFYVKRPMAGGHTGSVTRFG